jgi:hypothetical protein
VSYPVAYVAHPFAVTAHADTTSTVADRTEWVLWTRSGRCGTGSETGGTVPRRGNTRRAARQGYWEAPRAVVGDVQNGGV